jgi:hypothetical protein
MTVGDKVGVVVGFEDGMEEGADVILGVNTDLQIVHETLLRSPITKANTVSFVVCLVSSSLH